jgi:hypothetical protein
VSDTVSIKTTLLCRPKPPEPPIIPPGPKPPDASDTGHAGVRQARTCVGRRVARIGFRGTRIARIQVFVNGRLRRTLTMAPLQPRLTPRVRLAPGRRYRLRLRVTFQLGTGSPPVSLTRVITTCQRPAPPKFTG